MDGSDFLSRSAAFMGASGVSLGAFGAHSLRSKLEAKAGGLENWKTAVNYQLIHAVALLALSSLSRTTTQSAVKAACQKAGKMMVLGTSFFSGSIYMLVLDKGPKKILGPLTPVGGLFMIAGWVYLGLI